MSLIDFGLGLGKYDIALLYLCPAGAVIGSMAHIITQTISLDSPPNKEGEVYWASTELQKVRGAWMTLRLMLGAISGIVLGLYFVGAIQETPSTLAKIVALSVLVGYAAPKVWMAQEKIVSDQIMRLVKAELLKKELKKPLSVFEESNKNAENS